MFKKLVEKWRASRYSPAFFCKPTLSITFLNGQKIELHPLYFSITCANEPYCDWKLWVEDGMVVNQYPLSAIQEIVPIHWEIIPIKYKCSDLTMFKYSWMTYDEIQKKISEKIFENA